MNVLGRDLREGMRIHRPATLDGRLEVTGEVEVIEWCEDQGLFFICIRMDDNEICEEGIESAEVVEVLVDGITYQVDQPPCGTCSATERYYRMVKVQNRRKQFCNVCGGEFYDSSMTPEAS